MEDLVQYYSGHKWTDPDDGLIWSTHARVFEETDIDFAMTDQFGDPMIIKRVLMVRMYAGIHRVSPVPGVDEEIFMEPDAFSASQQEHIHALENKQGLRVTYGTAMLAWKENNEWQIMSARRYHEKFNA